MSRREWRVRVQDILDSIAAIQSYTRGMDYSAFAQDRKTIDAVLRNITVIGEAASQIPDSVQTASPEVPWRDMRDSATWSSTSTSALTGRFFGIPSRRTCRRSSRISARFWTGQTNRQPLRRGTRPFLRCQDNILSLTLNGLRPPRRLYTGQTSWHAAISQKQYPARGASGRPRTLWPDARCE